MAAKRRLYNHTLMFKLTHYQTSGGHFNNIVTPTTDQLISLEMVRIGCGVIDSEYYGM